MSSQKLALAPARYLVAFQAWRVMLWLVLEMNCDGDAVGLGCSDSDSRWRLSNEICAAGYLLDR